MLSITEYGHVLQIHQDITDKQREELLYFFTIYLSKEKKNSDKKQKTKQNEHCGTVFATLQFFFPSQQSTTSKCKSCKNRINAELNQIIKSNVPQYVQ